MCFLILRCFLYTRCCVCFKSLIFTMLLDSYPLLQMRTLRLRKLHWQGHTFRRWQSWNAILNCGCYPNFINTKGMQISISVSRICSWADPAGQMLSFHLWPRRPLKCKWWHLHGPSVYVWMTPLGGTCLMQHRMNFCYFIAVGEVRRKTKSTRWPGKVCHDSEDAVQLRKIKALGSLGSFTF